MSKKLNKVCICGHFAFGKNYLNGQTIKTKIVTKEVEKHFGECEVLKIDTHGGMKKHIVLPFILLNGLLKCENMVFLPAQNGLRIIAPILVLENLLFRRKLHYVVIGGWLSEFLEDKPYLSKILKRISFIYVETQIMQRKLQEKGFANVVVMPNCKELTILNESELAYPVMKPYKVCTFSRVMKEKGIEDAIAVVKKINQRFGKTVYELDIYGQIDDNQVEWFESLRKEFPKYVKYKGIIPFDKSVDVIKNYYVLLFPTRFYTEGIPGTIIDAYASGVPVVVSEWESYRDIVFPNVTGISYPFLKTEVLKDILIDIYVNPEKINTMKLNCIVKAKEYLPENVVDVLIKKIISL